MKTVPSSANMAEQSIASAMLYQTAGLVSKSLDTFASWLIAGFGAAVALLVTNHEARLVLPDYVIRDGAHWFLLAVSAAIVQKYLSVVVTGAASGAEAGAKLVTEYLERHPESARHLDLPFIVAQMQQGTLWILRWLSAGAHKRALAGDIVTSARRMVKVAQWQGLSVLAEIACFLTALYEIVTHLPS
jgi:prepilin signal peptidase PulO-like enzyme (type II secretory pathway)